jgi:DNA modification methylase
VAGVIHHGDCLDVMATLPEASVDAIVTDPPYGIGFMGKAWDGAAIEVAANEDRQARKSLGPHSESRPGRAQARSSSAFGGPSSQAGAYDFSLKGNVAFQHWTERWAAAALRVAKPGAYLLAFGATRTVHRMTVALEDAGWIIRDMLVWGYASGFPKSRALLKPAWEPIVMARKPGPLRELDIEGCRIGTEPSGWNGLPRTGQAEATDILIRSSSNKALCECGHHPISHPTVPTERCVVGTCDCRSLAPREASGRWPANVVLTDPIFDGGWEGVVGGGADMSHPAVVRNDTAIGGYHGTPSRKAGTQLGYPGEPPGTYSRFFLVPKASRSDREPAMPGMLEGRVAHHTMSGQPVPGRVKASRRNTHPTVKPTELMRHLVRLVTPPGGTVLDPFLGSGTTALAAEQEGRAWVGIEREAEYVRIAEARLAGVQRGMGLEVA